MHFETLFLRSLLLREEVSNSPVAKKSSFLNNRAAVVVGFSAVMANFTLLFKMEEKLLLWAWEITGCEETSDTEAEINAKKRLLACGSGSASAFTSTEKKGNKIWQKSTRSTLTNPPAGTRMTHAYTDTLF